MIENHSHNLPPEFELISKLETAISTLYFYEGFIIFEGNEGIVLSYETGFSDLLKVLQILNGKPWIYISNRVNSYSLNALDFKYLNHIPTLGAVAIINYSEISAMNAEFEGTFCTKPFKIFNSLDDAAIWTKTFL